MSGLLSDRLSAKAGLGLLGSFFAAFGDPGLIGELEPQFRANSVQTLRFQVDEPTRDYVDIGALGRALAKCRLRAGPLAGTKKRYYLTTGVVRAPSLTVKAQTGSGHEVAAKLDAMPARAKAAVSVERTGKDEIRFSGGKRLAIGVELVELVFDDKAGTARFRPQKGPLPLKGSERAFIGDPEGDAFIRLS